MRGTGRGASGRGGSSSQPALSGRGGVLQSSLGSGRGGSAAQRALSGGGGLSQSSLGSGGGASQPASHELVEAIIQLGYVPTQAKDASAEEKRLAVRLMRARKADLLTSEQEEALGGLAPRAAMPKARSGLNHYKTNIT